MWPVNNRPPSVESMPDSVGGWNVSLPRILPVRTSSAHRAPCAVTRPCCTEQGRVTAPGALWALDVRTGKILGKETFQPPTESGMLSTDGGLLFTGHMTGKFAAYDQTTLKEIWSFNVGTPITAPPISYSVGGKQYIAVLAGGGVGVRGGGLYQPSAFVAVFGL